MGAFSSNAFGNPGGPYTPRPDLGPGVGFGVGLPAPEFQEGGLDLTTQGFTQTLPGYQQNTNTVFPGNQQQPMTQGNGQLPPGFGAPSPIDRSQINPNVSIGFGMPPGGAMTGGNLNDANGNPIGGGFGTQMSMASPQMSGGFGGGKSMPGPNPSLTPRVNQGIIPVTQPRPAQSGIPMSQARRVNAPRPATPFARLRRR